MRYATIVLSGRYREIARAGHSPAARLSDTHAFCYSEFSTTLHALRRHRTLKRVLIECREDFLPGYNSAAETIRRDLVALRDSGVELHFHAPRYSEASLYIASGCNYRYIAPLGTVALSGFGGTFVFLRRLLERRGVRAEVFKRGAYKSAADALRSDSLEPAVRRQYQEYFDVQQREFNRTVCDGMSRSISQIDELIQGRVVHDAEAVEQGWVSEVVSLEQLRQRWKTHKIRPKKLKTRSRGYGRGKQVAVLAIDGAIVEGRSRRDPLMGNAVGSRSLARQIATLRENKKCAAVVLRINSPGGSASASELIRHELALLGECKPLVVSMSTVAASGGYWIACAAPLILAERTTLTGSIGVVGLVITAAKLFHRLGISFHALKTGPFRDIGSPVRAMTPDEKQLIEGEIDYTYQRFLTLVADSRKISVDHAHQLGQGRIWDGAEALQQHLVDEIGGLPQAVERAAAIAGVSSPGVRFHPQHKPTLLERLLTTRSTDALLSEQLSTPVPGMPAGGYCDPAQLAAAFETLRRTPLAILPQALYSTLHSTLSSM